MDRHVTLGELGLHEGGEDRGDETLAVRNRIQDRLGFDLPHARTAGVIVGLVADEDLVRELALRNKAGITRNTPENTSRGAR